MKILNQITENLESITLDELAKLKNYDKEIVDTLKKITLNQPTISDFFNLNNYNLDRILRLHFHLFDIIPLNYSEEMMYIEGLNTEDKELINRLRNLIIFHSFENESDYIKVNTFMTGNQNSISNLIGGF